jgi:hypothetical protein
MSAGSGSPVLPDPEFPLELVLLAELSVDWLPAVALLATALPLPLLLLLPAPVPVLVLWLELPAVLPALVLATEVAASDVPNPVDESEQAGRAPSASAKHETAIEEAGLFFMIHPGAGASARTSDVTIGWIVTPSKVLVAHSSGSRRRFWRVPARNGILR